MDREGFEKHLRRSGKEPHVIAALIEQVQQFERFLAGSGRGLDSAEVRDVMDYSAAVEAERPGAARKGLRGMALYFRFAGNPQLAEAASGLRDQAITRTRKAFPLREFLGVRPEHIAALQAAGIRDAAQLLEAGTRPSARRELAERTGIPAEALLELVRLSDLSRLEGVKAVRARLYYDAGLHSVEKIAAQEPEDLLRLTAAFVERTGFDGVAPLPKEVLHTIEAARRLPKLVVYD
jgi:hypothetical protein